MDYQFLRNLSYQCLLDLATTDGINASSLKEAYGCIFGRDSALTVLKILNVYTKTHDQLLLNICRRTLLTLTKLQGRIENMESGEEPGKFIHEYRKDHYERLLKREKPWYVYPDGILRNYDSVDSTPLTLIALYKYWKVTGDTVFLKEILGSVDQALQWITIIGDKDDDYFLEYELPVTRKHGGLSVQSWTDSQACLIRADGTFPDYPIAPIEVQAYTWLACKLWSDFFESVNPEKASMLSRYADQLKIRFNHEFIMRSNSSVYGVQALDGYKKQVQTITGNPLLCLWATYGKESNIESIIQDDYIPQFVSRAFQKDLFDPQAGIRTMSTLSQTFDSTRSSYHNGSFWPILNGLIHEGLHIWNYTNEAEALKKATLTPIVHFGFPIELYSVHKNEYQEYVSTTGKSGCRYQAWTAAVTLDLATV